MSDEGPANRCMTHRPPKPGQRWRLADEGYHTCSTCYDQLHQWLTPITVDDDNRPASIPGMYELLDARPGVGESGRRGPGFAPRSPANDHVVAMRDPRSTKLLAGDPHSVPGVLGSWCLEVSELRHVIPPARRVLAMAGFLDAHLDWLTRQDWVGELHAELRELYSQLKASAAGKTRRPIGQCPNTIDEGNQTRTCGALLFAPLRGDTIQCGTCGRQWARHEWLCLGDLLEAS